MDDIISKQVIENGIYKFKNFLTVEEVEIFKNLLSPYLKTKGHPETHFPVSTKAFFYKLLKFDFRKLFISLILQNLAKKKKLNYISNKIFKKQSYNNMIDCYFSKISNVNILPWHVDLAYGGKKDVSFSEICHPDAFSIKFFIYLTPVGPNNGCTSYIPESHKITYALRRGIKNNTLNYEPHWSLEQLLNFIKKNIQYFEDYFKGTDILNNFIKNAEELNTLNATNFDFFMEAGDAIIFDEGGVHKGSMPMLNDRAVIRYHFKVKEEHLN
jgi:ectoine hydroxylase-related dioxygenase (phytanoyl-CoA dioxygenase family)